MKTLICVVVVLSSVASAEPIPLRNGTKLEGTARYIASQVEITTAKGKMTVSFAEVDRAWALANFPHSLEARADAKMKAVAEATKELSAATNKMVAGQEAANKDNAELADASVDIALATIDQAKKIAELKQRVAALEKENAELRNSNMWLKIQEEQAFKEKTELTTQLIAALKQIAADKKPAPAK